MRIALILIILNLNISILAVEKIIIAKNNWTSQIVSSEILANIYKTVGIETEFKTVDVSKQWGELARGLLDVQVEVWEGTMLKEYERVVRDKKVEDLGSYDIKTREDWWYPLYVKEMCPGLPDWRALKKCSDIFKTKTSLDHGRYLGGPWEKPDKARVRALELNFIIERVSAGDELWVELEAAYKDKRPIILFNWTQNKYEGEFVEFPKYDPKCETDEKWGVNPKWKYDCGNPKDGWLKKIAWVNLKNKNACAYDVLKNMNYSNVDLATFSSYVDYDKLSHQDAATKWLSLNKNKWKKWITSNCK